MRCARCGRDVRAARKELAERAGMVVYGCPEAGVACAIQRCAEMRVRVPLRFELQSEQQHAKNEGNDRASEPALRTSVGDRVHYLRIVAHAPGSSVRPDG